LLINFTSRIPERKRMNKLLFEKSKILIVDDQQANIDLLEGFLEMEGYQNILSTSDPRTVLNLYESFAPDLILLDLAMPYLTGFKVMELLKQIVSADNYLPILVLSANITPEAKQRALAEGASDFLSKPFDLIEVGLRIRNLLSAKSMHQQLQNQNVILEDKVKERTAELELIAIDLLAAKERAESGDRLKTAFLQTISHEIRTPMNGILGFASLLASPDLTEGERAEYLELMKISSDRLVGTITDYVNISLIYTDNLQIQSQQVRLVHLLTDLESKFRKECDKKGLKLELQLPDHIFEFLLETDSELLRTVISHLIANAIKFTNKGFITFGFEILPSVIKIYVRDTGIGLGQESQQMIFEKFMQIDGSTTRNYEGSGLGLSICQGILKFLGSGIHIESDPDKGSVFSFTLPAKEYTDPEL